MTLPLPIALALGLAVAGLVLSLMLWAVLRQLVKRQQLADELLDKQGQQLGILQETLRTMGRQLVEQEARINTVDASAAVTVAVSTDTEAILQRLDAGETVAQIVEATGLDEVEVTLLKQIRDSKAT